MRVIFICFAMITFSQMTFAQPSPADHKEAKKTNKGDDIYDTKGCPDLLTLTGPVLRELYQAKDIHLKDIELLALSSARFVSETQVDLNQEIIIPVGAVLMIEIEACPSASGLRIEEDPIASEVKTR